MRNLVSSIIESEISLTCISFTPDFNNGIVRLPTPQPASQKVIFERSGYFFIHVITSSTVF